MKTLNIPSPSERQQQVQRTDIGDSAHLDPDYLLMQPVSAQHDRFASEDDEVVPFTSRSLSGTTTSVAPHDREVLSGSKSEGNQINQLDRPVVGESCGGPQPLKPSAIPYIDQDLPVLRISNISWDLTIGDIVAFFDPIPVPTGHFSPTFSQGAHIIMNRETGKTFSEAFVEFGSVKDAERAMAIRNRGFLKGRPVQVRWSRQSELMKALFPKWAGNDPLVQLPRSFAHVDPREVKDIPPALVSAGVVYGASGQKLAKEGNLLLREEINAMLTTCKNYKLHFSRKCAERPFENIISIISKIPWGAQNAVSQIHRDNIFEMLKISVQILKDHLSKESANIDESLLCRILRASICAEGFTYRQKSMLLKITDIECPNDLKCFHVQLEDTDNATAEGEEFLNRNSISEDPQKFAKKRSVMYQTPCKPPAVPNVGPLYPSPPNSAMTGPTTSLNHEKFSIDADPFASRISSLATADSMEKQLESLKTLCISLKSGFDRELGSHRAVVQSMSQYISRLEQRVQLLEQSQFVQQIPASTFGSTPGFQKSMATARIWEQHGLYNAKCLERSL
ncbi:hypothetical protein BJ742DRAFT_775969 [Cladochytrium replicatum]|nr:hypothetical protein BJ742DRAFT_775969 [Cladochytrium replicatum]